VVEFRILSSATFLLKSSTPTAATDCTPWTSLDRQDHNSSTSTGRVDRQQLLLLIKLALVAKAVPVLVLVLVLVLAIHR
jgi:hypothetical protein